jgi:hypothetical protein
MDILYLVVAALFFAGTAWAVAKLPDRREGGKP